MFGRVHLCNLVYAIFAAGSILLFLTPKPGDAGDLELVAFKLVQGIDASFLFSTSATIKTDAFPENERGRAFLLVNWGYYPPSAPFYQLGLFLSLFCLKWT